jgi:hypothetical protein
VTFWSALLHITTIFRKNITFFYFYSALLHINKIFGKIFTVWLFKAQIPETYSNYICRYISMRWNFQAILNVHYIRYSRGVDVISDSLTCTYIHTYAVLLLLLEKNFAFQFRHLFFGF